MRYLKLGGVFATGLIMVGIAFSQQSPPTENKGVAVKPVGAMDLGTEIDGLSGRQLRMRFITLEPGGHFAVHNHAGVHPCRHGRRVSGRSGKGIQGGRRRVGRQEHDALVAEQRD